MLRGQAYSRYSEGISGNVPNELTADIYILKRVVLPTSPSALLQSNCLFILSIDYKKIQPRWLIRNYNKYFLVNHLVLELDQPTCIFTVYNNVNWSYSNRTLFHTSLKQFHWTSSSPDEVSNVETFPKRPTDPFPRGLLYPLSRLINYNEHWSIYFPPSRLSLQQYIQASRWRH